MAKNLETVVREILGQQLLTIAQLQVQIEDLTEQLAEAKRAAETGALRRVPRDDREVG